MQSLTRALRRGNAIVYFDNVTKKPEIQYKHGTTTKWWLKCLRDALPEASAELMAFITKPITKAMVDKANEKGDRVIVNNMAV